MIAQYSQMVKQSQENSVLRARQRLGKYRIERRLAQGGFAYVYAAMDTIEGVRVALKMPHQNIVTPGMLECFQREARLVARLDHPNILPLKDASFIDGRFVIASRLGERSLNDRLRKRMSFETALELSQQMVAAVAYAHKQKIIHCDLKPENMILLPDGRLQLADFGIAKVAQRTVNGSGSGTVGYMAPRTSHGAAEHEERCVFAGPDHVPHVHQPPTDLSLRMALQRSCIATPQSASRADRHHPQSHGASALQTLPRCGRNAGRAQKSEA